jgi:hypothetical protein
MQFITDVNIVAGCLIAEVTHLLPSGKPSKKRSVYVLNSIHYSWLSEPLVTEVYHISTDAQRVECPLASRTIHLHEIIENANRYFCSWSTTSKTTSVPPGVMTGCWRAPFRLYLLHCSGMAVIKNVGRGRASDLVGHWEWALTSERTFVLTRMDIDQSDRDRFRQEFRISRYDGMIIELIRRSGFDLDPAGFLDVQLWKREKLPKSWTKWA